jgi:hypothetical protein
MTVIFLNLTFVLREMYGGGGFSILTCNQQMLLLTTMSSIIHLIWQTKRSHTTVLITSFTVYMNYLLSELSLKNKIIIKYIRSV